MRKVWHVALCALVVAGCNGKRKELEAALSQTQLAAAERDSLLSEVLETTQMVNELNGELTRVRGLGVTPVLATERGWRTAASEDRAIALGKVREVIARLDSAESRLARSEQRVKELSRRDERLATQLAEYRRTLAELRETSTKQEAELQAIIAEQQRRIAALTATVDTVRRQNAVLTDTVAALTEAQNTVYYVAGTKSELLKLGVVANEGSKFLFFGSKKLLPARTLAPTAFTRIDRMRDTVLPLPRADRAYRIVSRHDSQLLASPSKDGKVRGEIHIVTPPEFWTASKFLILVED